MSRPTNTLTGRLLFARVVTVADIGNLNASGFVDVNTLDAGYPTALIDQYINRAWRAVYEELAERSPRIVSRDELYTYPASTERVRITPSESDSNTILKRRVYLLRRVEDMANADNPYEIPWVEYESRRTLSSTRWTDDGEFLYVFPQRAAARPLRITYVPEPDYVDLFDDTPLMQIPAEFQDAAARKAVIEMMGDRERYGAPEHRAEYQEAMSRMKRLSRARQVTQPKRVRLGRGFFR